ncbi:hypothetical protein SLEP1_g42831 [Rubroshorea leprosula]|uniref:Uncharacterized protein n=1 Tax=Rubroshorea leprosula TaxID=152421 RepID=A0AAV5LB21_9ROSI|nr:hypothetical protein SLEP1_g42831 [Rubroshorea leprosula]
MSSIKAFSTEAVCTGSAYLCLPASIFARCCRSTSISL